MGTVNSFRSNHKFHLMYFLPKFTFKSIQKNCFLITIGANETLNCKTQLEVSSPVGSSWLFRISCRPVKVMASLSLMAFHFGRWLEYSLFTYVCSTNWNLFYWPIISILQSIVEVEYWKMVGLSLHCAVKRAVLLVRHSDSGFSIPCSISSISPLFYTFYEQLEMIKRIWMKTYQSLLKESWKIPSKSFTW